MASSKSASHKGQSKSRSNGSGSQATASRSGNSSRSKGAAATARETGDAIKTAARRAKGPMLAAGATAAGLAAGLALGSRASSKRRGVGALLAPQRKVLGVPVGTRKSAVVRTTEALGKVARELSLATSQVSATTDEIRQVREQLDKANRQSPLEVLLDGLTHRRGAHKRES